MLQFLHGKMWGRTSWTRCFKSDRHFCLFWKVTTIHSKRKNEFYISYHRVRPFISTPEKFFTSCVHNDSMSMTRFDKIWNNEDSLMWIDGLGQGKVQLYAIEISQAFSPHTPLVWQNYVVMTPIVFLTTRTEKMIHFCVLIRKVCKSFPVRNTKHFVFDRIFIPANVKPFNCVLLLRTTKICRSCFFTFEIRRLCYKISQSKIYLEKRTTF